MYTNENPLTFHITVHWLITPTGWHINVTPVTWAMTTV